MLIKKGSLSSLIRIGGRLENWTYGIHQRYLFYIFKQILEFNLYSDMQKVWFFRSQNLDFQKFTQKELKLNVSQKSMTNHFDGLSLQGEKRSQVLGSLDNVQFIKIGLVEKQLAEHVSLLINMTKTK